MRLGEVTVKSAECLFAFRSAFRIEEMETEMSNFDLDKVEGHESFNKALLESISLPCPPVSGDANVLLNIIASPQSVLPNASNIRSRPAYVPLSSSVQCCNICKEIKALSEDHVPPKSCQLSKFNKKHWVSYVFDGSWKPRVAQGKVKFGTICEDCNNFLGRDADTELLALIQEIRSCSQMKIGKVKKFNTEKLILCLVGHLLAQIVDLDLVKSSSFITQAREFVLSRKPKSGRPPSSLNGFNVFYSFNQEVDGYTVMTDTLLLHRKKVAKGKPRTTRGIGVGKSYEPYYIQVLKMPEISFIVSSTDDFLKMPKMRMGTAKWMRIALRGERRDAVAKYKYWPESAGEYVGFMMLLGASGMRSTYATTTSVKPPEFIEPSPEDEAFIKLAAKSGLLIKLTKGR
jgi:hypothetical protein